jgi:ribonuclease HI
MGIGIVIRDAVGQVIAAKALMIPYVIDPAGAEAIAAWHAICFGRDMGGSRVILEGDSKVVALALSRRSHCNQANGFLIEDSWTMFSFFNSVEVSHVKREANKATHVLARNAISQLLDKVWVADCPPLISPIVLAEQDISS